jgi:hypothetical protein
MISIMLGRTISHYRIVERLGGGRYDKPATLLQSFLDPRLASQKIQPMTHAKKYSYRLGVAIKQKSGPSCQFLTNPDCVYPGRRLSHRSIVERS